MPALIAGLACLRKGVSVLVAVLARGDLGGGLKRSGLTPTDNIEATKTNGEDRGPRRA